MEPRKKTKKTQQSLGKTHKSRAGTRLKKILLDKSKNSERMKAPKQQPKSLLERLASVVGKVKGLPPDMSVNHDHYLYGVPKRES